MFKEIFTRLIRHLPSRLVHRDPLPGAQQTVNTAVPPSLSAHCLKMAVMPEEELWKTFDTHPEGLNQAEVESAREQHGENKLPAQQPSPWWVHLWVCYRNPFNILLTILGAISYATEDLFAAGVIALMVAISTLLNFIQEARSTKAADALKAMVSKGFRNPTIREMYMFPPQNPDLQPERLMNYELSFSQTQLDGALSYGANLFYINGDNLITTTRVDGRPHNVNSGDIENWGLEANAAWRIDPRWSVNANYSWVHMENPVISAPQHKLYAGADFHQGRWAVSTGVQYVKGLYTSVGTDATTEDFVLWNVRASYHLCPYASLFVRGENLLAQRYEIMAGYPMPKATFLGGVNVSF